jgi:hypothetical protein
VDGKAAAAAVDDVVFGLFFTLAVVDDIAKVRLNGIVHLSKPHIKKIVTSKNIMPTKRTITENKDESASSAMVSLNIYFVYDLYILLLYLLKRRERQIFLKARVKLTFTTTIP